ncbi:hypothetical protein EYZ11_007137 [Aspergillus tanneri]|uniref:Uncharacterized protein n=1 Tax=Aspergillus tanneri TaxID=1220188 RepID=A0A4S3JE01_9EURO|nr:uncharacterized protein ATNIH1004_010667 [Aspergillus tanneri]KAA8641728.1 hypothetical protein ATNIH1004_010667 [Aspergillus tanneri]THC93380.1 hypothetical protein EYZ11_007137 [Aspergillus tanneri]
MGVLEGKVVIVTGSASGIGLATTQAAVKEGARVLAVDVSSRPSSLESNPNLEFLQCDLTGASAAAEITCRCLEAFGGVNVLVNVAGVIDHCSSVDTLTDDMWERCMAINLTAPVRLMREVLPIMKEQKGGSIVNISSKAGSSGAVSGVAYTASKHALQGVTKNVAWRFKADNIRCNAICPGGVTSAISSSVDNSAIDFAAVQTMLPIIDSVKVHRPDFELVRAEDVANAIIFLSSDNSLRISGAMLPIDDGWSTI